MSVNMGTEMRIQTIGLYNDIRISNYKKIAERQWFPSPTQDTCPERKIC